MKYHVLRLRLRDLFCRFFQNQRGSVAVITAVSITALIGFAALVLDLGGAYNEASKLQNALDSAVLAAAQELPAENSSSEHWGAAKNEAVSLSEQNNYRLTPDEIKPIYEDDISSNRIIGIKVTKSIEVSYNFARVFGVNSSTITRTASAELAPAGGLRNAVPLSITSSALSNAIAKHAVDNLTIKCCSTSGDIGIDCTGDSGWFGALRFEDSGASVYEALLAYGYQGDLYVGQILDMENGNMSGPTLDGFTTRYYSCTSGCTPACYEADCPRLVYIPVVEILPKDQVKIVSFATFFLTECGGSGNDCYIKATYIPDVVVPDAVAGSSAQDFGVYVTRLNS